MSKVLIVAGIIGWIAIVSISSCRSNSNFTSTAQNAMDNLTPSPMAIVEQTPVEHGSRSTPAPANAQSVKVVAFQTVPNVNPLNSIALVKQTDISGCIGLTKKNEYHRVRDFIFQYRPRSIEVQITRSI